VTKRWCPGAGGYSLAPHDSGLCRIIISNYITIRTAYSHFPYSDWHPFLQYSGLEPLYTLALILGTK
jgi:hypothetical protein